MARRGDAVRQIHGPRIEGRGHRHEIVTPAIRQGRTWHTRRKVVETRQFAVVEGGNQNRLRRVGDCRGHGLGAARGLQLDVHRNIRWHRPQHLAEGGNPLASSRVQPLQFRQGDLAHQAGAVGGAVHALVVNHHGFAVRAQVDVQFHAVNAVFHRLGETGQRVLRRQAARATVSEDDEAVAQAKNAR